MVETESKQNDDKSELKPISENIWYALATIAEDDPVKNITNNLIQNKNRYYWNGYIGHFLSDDDRKRLKEHNDTSINKVEVPNLSPKELAFIHKTLAARGFEKSKIKELKSGAVVLSYCTSFFSPVFSGYIFPNFRSERSHFGYAYFNKAVFINLTSFRNVTFSIAHFTDATFLDNTVFSDCSSKFFTNFRGATFKKKIEFKQHKFEGMTSFHDVVFVGLAEFENCFLGKHTSFQSSEFQNNAHFYGTTFKATMNFQNTIFKLHPPEFYNASISENVFWAGSQFPNNKHRDENHVEKHVNAYEYLALMMSKLQRHHDQHMFFRYEMRARRVLEKKWSAPRTMNWFYEKTCDYGYGFERALKWWIANILVGMYFLIPTNVSGTSRLWEATINSAATSFANCHSFLGLNRGALKNVYEYYDDGTYELLVPFNVIWMFQALFGIVFLFFLLLTIRNRFRMQ